MLDNVRFIEKEDPKDDVTWATHFLFQQSGKPGGPVTSVYFDKKT